MKYKIRGWEEGKEPEVEMWLEPTSGGGVKLRMKRQGFSVAWDIIRFENNLWGGRWYVHRIGLVGNELGLMLDEAGKVVID